METKKKKIVCFESREIIARVYHFLKEEYAFLAATNHDKCDLSPLRNIRQRTAAATGVSEFTVSKILKEEKDPFAQYKKAYLCLEARLTKARVSKNMEGSAKRVTDSTGLQDASSGDIGQTLSAAPPRKVIKQETCDDEVEATETKMVICKEDIKEEIICKKDMEEDILCKEHIKKEVLCKEGVVCTEEFICKEETEAINIKDEVWCEEEQLQFFPLADSMIPDT